MMQFFIVMKTVDLMFFKTVRTAQKLFLIRCVISSITLFNIIKQLLISEIETTATCCFVIIQQSYDECK
jgi:hypothetical protein